MEHKWAIKIRDAQSSNPKDENAAWTEGETIFTYDTREDAYDDVYALWQEQQGIRFSDHEIYIRGTEDELAKITDEFVLGECEVRKNEKGSGFEMTRTERDFIHDAPREAVFWVRKPEYPADDIILITKEDFRYLKHSDQGISSEEILESYELAWGCLPKKITGNLPYDHYPHGRVVIHDQEAVIYVDPCIRGILLKCCLTVMCNLNTWNGIQKVEMRSEE